MDSVSRQPQAGPIQQAIGNIGEANLGGVKKGWMGERIAKAIVARLGGKKTLGDKSVSQYILQDRYKSHLLKHSGALEFLGNGKGAAAQKKELVGNFLEAAFKEHPELSEKKSGLAGAWKEFKVVILGKGGLRASQQKQLQHAFEGFAALRQMGQEHGEGNVGNAIRGVLGENITEGGVLFQREGISLESLKTNLKQIAAKLADPQAPVAEREPAIEVKSAPMQQVSGREAEIIQKLRGSKAVQTNIELANYAKATREALVEYHIKNLQAAAEKGRIKGAVAELTGKINTLGSEKRAIEKSIKSQKKELASIDSRNESLEKIVDKMQTELGKLEGQKRQLGQTILEQQRKVGLLETRLTELTEERAAKDAEKAGKSKSAIGLGKSVLKGAANLAGSSKSLKGKIKQAEKELNQAKAALEKLQADPRMQEKLSRLDATIQKAQTHSKDAQAKLDANDKLAGKLSSKLNQLRHQRDELSGQIGELGKQRRAKSEAIQEIENRQKQMRTGAQDMERILGLAEKAYEKASARNLQAIKAGRSPDVNRVKIGSELQDALAMAKANIPGFKEAYEKHSGSVEEKNAFLLQMARGQKPELAKSTTNAALPEHIQERLLAEGVVSPQLPGEQFTRSFAVREGLEVVAEFKAQQTGTRVNLDRIYDDPNFVGGTGNSQGIQTNLDGKAARRALLEAAPDSTTKKNLTKLLKQLQKEPAEIRQPIYSLLHRIHDNVLEMHPNNQKDQNSALRALAKKFAGSDVESLRIGASGVAAKLDLLANTEDVETQEGLEKVFRKIAGQPKEAQERLYNRFHRLHADVLRGNSDPGAQKTELSMIAQQVAGGGNAENCVDGARDALKLLEQRFDRLPDNAHMGNYLARMLNNYREGFILAHQRRDTRTDAGNEEGTGAYQILEQQMNFMLMNTPDAENTYGIYYASRFMVDVDAMGDLLERASDQDLKKHLLDSFHPQSRQYKAMQRLSPQEIRQQVIPRLGSGARGVLSGMVLKGMLEEGKEVITKEHYTPRNVMETMLKGGGVNGGTASESSGFQRTEFGAYTDPSTLAKACHEQVMKEPEKHLPLAIYREAIGLHEGAGTNPELKESYARYKAGSDVTNASFAYGDEKELLDKHMEALKGATSTEEVERLKSEFVNHELVQEAIEVSEYEIHGHIQETPALSELKELSYEEIANRMEAGDATILAIKDGLTKKSMEELNTIYDYLDNPYFSTDQGTYGEIGMPKPAFFEKMLEQNGYISG